MNQTENSFFDYSRWEAQADQLRRQFTGAEPFPHLVIDQFLDASFAQKIKTEFPDPSSPNWTHYKHFNERKQAQTKRELIPLNAGRLIDEFNGPRFIRFLEQLTGIPRLLPDPQLEGGGLHQVEPGGFLNIHADFTSHPYKKNWTRRVNMLIYFNEGWQESYGGHLELWDKSCKRCCKKILPVFNRSVFFATDRDSFHGHPEPLRCPPGATSKSIAPYYFTEEAAAPFARSTEYRARPEDGPFKRAVILIDKLVLRMFDKLKRSLGLSNELAEKILRFLFK